MAECAQVLDLYEIQEAGFLASGYSKGSTCCFQEGPEIQSQVSVPMGKHNSLLTG